VKEHPELREILESRREAVEACTHWRSIDTAVARARLKEFEVLVADLDREIDEAIRGLTSTPADSAISHRRDGK
jgi:hypothetical protein